MAEYIDYHKKFDSFEEGASALIGFVPDLALYFGDKLTENDVIQKLTLKYLENPYSTTNPNFPYTYLFKSDTHGIFFNTDKRVNFGWKPRLNGDTAYFVFHVSFPNSNKSVSQINLTNDGWETSVFSLGKKTSKKKEEKDDTQR